MYSPIMTSRIPACRAYDTPPPYDCFKLIAGEKQEQNHVFRHRRAKDPLPDITFRNLTRKCEEFKENHCYIQDFGPSNEEAEFPLSFSILAYHYVEQVERLLRAIYRPQNVYCIHIDVRADENFKISCRQ